MAHAKLAATRSTCLACQVGAVIVKGDRLLSQGYNGLPSKFPHCSEMGCCIDGSENCALSPQSLAVHAEANAIGQLAKGNGGAEGAIIYCTLEPCLNCLKAIVSAGIVGVYFEMPHKDNDLKKLMIDRGFVYEQLSTNSTIFPASAVDSSQCETLDTSKLDRP